MGKKLLIILFLLEITFVTSCGNKTQALEPATPTVGSHEEPAAIRGNKTQALESATPTDRSYEEPAAIRGNITREWISLERFSPDASVTIEIYESEGGPLRAEPFTVPTNGDGNGSFEGNQFELNLQPGMYIVSSDDASEIVRELTLENISIDVFDINLDKVAGTAPPEAVLEIIIHDEILNEGFDMEVIADLGGNWSADFWAEMEVDLNENMNPQALMFDEDSDATIAEFTGPPYIEGNLPLDWISGSLFSPNSTATIEIYDYEGGSLIGEPFIVDTNWKGEVLLEGSEVGVDLQPGMYLVIRDNNDDELEKGLTLVDVAIDTPNFESNELKGYGPSDTWLTFEMDDHVNGDNYFTDVLSDGDGNWYLDFYTEFGVPIPSEDYCVHIKLYDEDGDASIADPLGELE